MDGLLGEISKGFKLKKVETVEKLFSSQGKVLEPLAMKKPLHMLYLYQIQPDFTIKTRTKEYKVHKFIIAFAPSLLEIAKTKDEIIVPIEEKYMEVIIDHFYGKSLFLNYENYGEVYLLAKILDLPPIMDKVLSTDFYKKDLKSIIPNYQMMDKYLTEKHQSRFVNDTFKCCLTSAYQSKLHDFNITQSLNEQFLSLTNDQKLELISSYTYDPEISKDPFLGAHRFLAGPKNRHFYDITIISKDQKEFQAHKALLCMNSEFLAQLLTSKVVKLDYSSVDIENLLNYCYNGVDFNISKQVLEDLNEKFKIYEIDPKQKEFLEKEKIRLEEEKKKLEEEMKRNSIRCSYPGCNNEAIYACCNKLNAKKTYTATCIYLSCQSHCKHKSTDCTTQGRTCSGADHDCSNNGLYCGLISEFGKDQK